MPIYALHDRRPRLPSKDRYWIAPNACVIGDVVLGEDCGVWFWREAARRQRNDIDRRPHEYPGRLHSAYRHGLSALHWGGLHDWTQCHPARLRDRGRFAGRHGRDCSQRRENCGRRCLVGAGALVTEGKIFPDGSLIVGATSQSEARAGRCDDRRLEKIRGRLRRQMAATLRRGARCSRGIRRL